MHYQIGNFLEEWMNKGVCDFFLSITKLSKKKCATIALHTDYCRLITLNYEVCRPSKVLEFLKGWFNCFCFRKSFIFISTSQKYPKSHSSGKWIRIFWRHFWKRLSHFLRLLSAKESNEYKISHTVQMLWFLADGQKPASSRN